MNRAATDCRLAAGRVGGVVGGGPGGGGHLGAAAVGAVMAVDLAFPLALRAVLAREIVAGRNWKNLPVLALALGLILDNDLYHIDAA